MGVKGGSTPPLPKLFRMKQKIILGGHKMAKKVEKKTVVENSKGKKAPVSPFANLTREELVARYKANVAERKRISEENKELIRLHQIAKAQKKTHGKSK
jgi:hypothetical protein